MAWVNGEYRPHSVFNSGDIVVYTGQLNDLRRPNIKTLTEGKTYMVEFAWCHGIQLRNDNNRIITISPDRNLFRRELAVNINCKGVQELVLRQKLFKFLKE